MPSAGSLYTYNSRALGPRAGFLTGWAFLLNGAMPAPLARTHPVHKTPHVAITFNVVGGVVVALLLGWKWGPLLAFATIATAITVVVILIYIAVCLGSILYYYRERRSEFNPLLHLFSRSSARHQPSMR